MGACHGPSLGDTGPVDTARAGERTHGSEDAPLVIEVFGVRWSVTFHGLDPELEASLRRLWHRARISDLDGATPESGPEVKDLRIMSADLHEQEPVSDLETIVIGDDKEDAPYTISRAITTRSISRRRGEALMLHGVGVSAPDGRTVALVAPSGTGKTTAAKALGRHLGYVSDETVIVEPSGRIRPYAKPLSIITDTTRAHVKHEHSPDDLGLLHATPDESLVLGAMVILRREKDLPGPELSSEPLIDAILETIPETSSLPTLEHPLDRLCWALTRSGGPFKLRYPEIEDCIDLVVGLTRADPDRDADAPTWQHIPGEQREPAAVQDTATGHDPTTVEWGALLVRTRWDDAILAEGEAILLRDLVPVRLSPVGTLLWHGADTPTSIADLHDQVVDRIGPHPRAHALVLEAAQLLVDAKILALVGTR